MAPTQMMENVAAMATGTVGNDGGTVTVKNSVSETPMFPAMSEA
jgi:hypothetical protein